MQGYWWPGRQLVVVLPLAVLCAAGWLARLGTRARLSWLSAGLWGLAVYVTVLVAGLRDRATWVEGPLDSSLHPVWSAVLPNLRVLAGAVAGSEPAEIARYGVWSIVVDRGRRDRGLGLAFGPDRRGRGRRYFDAAKYRPRRRLSRTSTSKVARIDSSVICSSR